VDTNGILECNFLSKTSTVPSTSASDLPGSTIGTASDAFSVRACVRACVRASVRACVRASVRACVRVSVRAYAYAREHLRVWK
jgi:hypothetical protein